MRHGLTASGVFLDLLDSFAFGGNFAGSAADFEVQWLENAG